MRDTQKEQQASFSKEQKEQNVTQHQENAQEDGFRYDYDDSSNIK